MNAPRRAGERRPLSVEDYRRIAEAGVIPEAWLIDLGGGRVSLHAQPDVEG